MFLLAVISLFTGALSSEKLCDWQFSDGVSAVVEKGGVLLKTDSSAPINAYAKYETAVPPDMRGTAVVQEIQTRNCSKLVWSGEIWIEQLDEAGNILPETLADYRWTTHMRPPGRDVFYRHPGHIHPKACSLRLHIELRRPSIEFDAYGMSLKDKSISYPSLFLSRLAVKKKDADLNVNSDFFTKGVSEEENDYAFVCGGAAENAFSYQTHTRGAWSNAYQFRDEDSLAFPSADGTVEAWFKPDWDKTDAGTNSVTVFEGYQGYTSLKKHKWRRTLLHLGYSPVSRKATFFISDWKGNEFRSEFPSVEIPDKVWTHIAVQWTPNEHANLFIAGKCIGQMPINGFEAVPLADLNEKNPNDLWITEFFIGAPCRKIKDKEDAPVISTPFFTCAVDLLRVSTSCRYKGEFIPQKKYCSDSKTRALFSFDRCYDGVQGGGFGFIPGTVYSNEGRYKGSIKKERLSSELPFDVFNYKKLSSPGEYKCSHVTRNAVFTVEPGSRFKVKTAENIYPDFVEIDNISSEMLLYPVLTADGRVDPSSFADIADTLELNGKTDREKVDSLFQYVLASSDYFVNRQVRFSNGTDKGHNVCNDALIMLNAYCGFECGYLNNLAANLFAVSAQCPAAQAAGYGHSFQQVFFNGRDHLYDVARQRYFPRFSDGEPASLADIEDEPGIIGRTGIPPNNYLRKGTRVRGGHGANDPRYQEKAAQSLYPGERMRIYSGNDGRMNNLHHWPKRGRYTGFRLGPDEYDYTERIHADPKDITVYRRDRFFPEYGNLFICFDGKPQTDNPAFCRIGKDSFCYNVKGVCPVVWAEYSATSTKGEAIALSVSTDGGTTFRPLPQGEDGVSSLEYLLRARDGYLIRIEAPINNVSRFYAVTERQFNVRTYPGWVQPGETDYTFKASSGSKTRVTVSWKEAAKEIVVDGGVYNGSIPGFERQIFAFDPGQKPSYKVTGASDKAKIAAYGRVNGSIDNGIITLSYAPDKKPLMPRGDDSMDQEEEFPAIASVDITDGDAVKTLTVIISPEIRLIPATAAKVVNKAELRSSGDESIQPRLWCTQKGDGAVFPCENLSKGEYAVFALARFAVDANREGACFELKDPARNLQPFRIASPVNPTADYLFAPFGTSGKRSRWKWDCGYRPDLQLPYNGWIIRMFGEPGEDGYEVRLSGDVPTGAELAALLIIKSPGLEARADLRKILFGLNCDPAHVKSNQIKGMLK